MFGFIETHRNVILFCVVAWCSSNSARATS